MYIALEHAECGNEWCCQHAHGTSAVLQLDDPLTHGLSFDRHRQLPSQISHAVTFTPRPPFGTAVHSTLHEGVRGGWEEALTSVRAVKASAADFTLLA